MKIGAKFYSICALLISLALSGCVLEQFWQEEEQVITFAGEAASFDSLGAIKSFDVFVDKENKMHLAVDSGARRFYLFSEDGGEHWSEPLLVSSDPSNSKQGNDIQVAASKDDVLIVWKGVSELPGWGAAQLAVSDNQGVSWEQLESPAKGDVLQNQGYFSLAANEESFHLLWLDDREEEGNRQGLRYASSLNGLKWDIEQTIETGLCTCCWVSTILSGSKIHALYRGEGPRDMKFVTGEVGKNNWRSSVRVGEFDWDFVGCPHQGGALAESSDGTLHSVVWTGKEEVAGLHYLVSNDGGSHWQNKQAISGGEGQHVDMAANSETVLIVWDSLSEKGNIIQLLAKNKNDHAMALSMNSEGFARPRVVASGDNFRLFWTDLDKMGKKRLKTIKIKQINRKVER